MVLWEHPFERYLALASLTVIAISLAILAGKRLTEPPALILETPTQKQGTKPLKLKVHVKGAVQKPSVYSLPFGSRVFDAIKLAQPRQDADLNSLNLAAFLEDGQEVFVPSKNRLLNSPNLALPSSVTLQPPLKVKPTGKTPKTIVNLNTASELELIQLPGIGPSLAKRIIEYRRKIGGFKSIEQLLEVKGIGEKKLEQIRPYVRL
ncbi:MAG: helix-hairpin-helix domain-containing protein [Armatimonadetes bacterium]|nr:helix-hairpin-helix domain-containing protein [Armatimonadota bacterium]MDW8028101.1 helix-hairpin-helix domain-containing protein [Armatimonadota bacterium]